MRSSYSRLGSGSFAGGLFSAEGGHRAARNLLITSKPLNNIVLWLGVQRLVLLLLLLYQSLISASLSGLLIPIAFLGSLSFLRNGTHFRTTAVFFVVGLSVPLLGRVDVNAIRLLALCALIVGWQKDYRAWFSHFLILLWIGFILLAFREGFFWDLPWDVQRNALEQSSLLSVGPFGVALAVTLFAYSCEVFSKNDLAAKGFRAGLGLGLGLALPFLMLEIVGLPALAESSSFWSHVGRMSGTFSDPNAWGVFSLCLLPVLLHEKRHLLAVLWTGLSLFSGSRLLILCIGLTVGRLWIKKWTGGYRSWLLILLMGFGLVLLAGLYSASELPSPLARQLRALDLSRIGATFDSRTKFWRLAWDVWQEWPLTGVGFGIFSTVLTSHAVALGDDMNLWIDNPNSTYLWVLAEFGALGLFALVLGVFELGLRPARREHLLFGLFTVLLALQFGPHLFFVEFGLLLAYLVALNLTRKGECGGGFRAKWLLAGLFIIWARNVQYGWYGWEREGAFVQRWAAPRAQAFFPCRDGSIRFEMRAMAPQLVTINGPQESRNFPLTAGVWRSVAIPCRNATRLGFESKYPWVPSQEGFPGDYRILGFQIRVSPELSFKLR